MAGYVYVMPVEFVKGVCGDLAKSNAVKEAVTITYDKIIGGPTPGFNVAMTLDLASPIVVGGRVSVSCLGAIKPGAVEAERSTIQLVLDEIRHKYQFFPTDYNLIVISEKMALFKAMQAAMGTSHADSIDLSVASNACLNATQELCRSVSIWIGDNHLFGDRGDLLSVSAFHAVMEQQARKLKTVVNQASRTCDLAFFGLIIPDGFDRIYDYVQSPTEISWDTCFRSLHVICIEAMKKLRGMDAPQFVVRRANGQYTASVKLIEEPFQLVASPADTQDAALAKLFFVVIKHVNDLGFDIFDIHHEMRQYLDDYIARFDRNMKYMLQSGEMLQVAIDEIADLFDSSVVELTKMLDINDVTEVVLDLVSSFSAHIKKFKLHIQQALNRLKGRQVLRIVLEANLAGQP